MKKYISLIAVFLVFINATAQQKEGKVYGNNLVTISPLVAYGSTQLSDVGVGIGYERFLNDHISAKVPLNFGLSNSMIQTGLGLKFYPAGHRRAVKYSVGPTILFTNSKSTTAIDRFDSVNNFWYSEDVDNPLMQLGFVLNNSLNVTIQKNIYIGAELGLGLNYINDFDIDPVNGNQGFFVNENPGILALFNLSLGYRF